MSDLGREIARVRADTGGGRAMIEAFRMSVLLVPLLVDSAAEQAYLTVRGSRLLDVAIPGLGIPAGVAIDVAGAQPMLLPPVTGIVREEVAVDAGHRVEVA